MHRPLSSFGLPHIVEREISVGGEKWQLCCYDEHDAILRNFHYATTVDVPFTDVQTIHGVPLLIGFFPEEKKVRTTTMNATRELFLFEHIDKDEEALDIIAADVSLQGCYHALKKHVAAIGTLDPQKTLSVFERVTKEYHLTDLFSPAVNADVSKAEKSMVCELVERVRHYQRGPFEWFSDFFLNFAVDSPVLRVNLLKLIAALPSLDHDRSGREVKRIFLEAMRHLSSLPFSFLFFFRSLAFCIKLTPSFVAAMFIQRSVRLFAQRFIAGENIESAKSFLQKLKASGRDVTLDRLGEQVVSRQEADRYCNDVIKLIRGFAQYFPRGERNQAGTLRAHVSIKISALTHEFKPHAPEATHQEVFPRLKRILLTAQEEQVFINIDAEHYPYRDLTLTLLRRTLLETPELEHFADVGVVLQAYLRDAALHLRDIVALAKERGVRLPVRLVKGAYWDAETIEAKAHNFPAPQFLNKEETDLHFRQLIIAILDWHPHLQLCLASHNIQDHCFAEALVKIRYSQKSPPPDFSERGFTPRERIEHQCLHGTYEALSVGMARHGWVVRNYIPVGSLLIGMAYLVRRIMENSSQIGILSIMRAHIKPETLKTPQCGYLDKKQDGKLHHDPTLDLSPHFRNVTPLRLFLTKERDAFIEALMSFKDRLGQTLQTDFPFHGETKKILSPSDPNVHVGTLTLANKADALTAIATSRSEAEKGIWQRLPAILRASILMRAASLFLTQRSELAALMIHEGGKSATEALADVDEAIDFINFYSREAVNMCSHLSVIPRGVVAVISPWNFPLAIPCGMTAGPLATGNCVILKPAEHTPLIAARMVEIFHEAGVPKCALLFLPGPGKEVGTALVESPHVDAIVFTGSKTVGQWIMATAGKKMCRPPLRGSMPTPAKVITEMGGKNAIIVTNNAELDETIAGILYSCFGNAGQKCSAASRVLVDQTILERFLNRFIPAVNDITVGPAFDLATTMNPLIALSEKKRLENIGDAVRKEALAHGGKVLVDRQGQTLPGCCLGPLVILLPQHRAMDRESFACQELFGPIVHVIPFATLDEAIAIAHSTEYGLTGGIFSQSEDDIDDVLKRFHTGNIYVNRHITGARVSIEPFGGFKHSGTGPKAGGKGYVESFSLCAPRPPLSLQEKMKDADRFFSWLQENIQDVLIRRHSNRTIPGQLSYNDNTHIREKGTFIVFRDEPTSEALRFCLSGAMIGCRLSILARTTHAEKTWKTMCKRFGLDVDINLTNEEGCKLALEDQKVSFLFIDGNEEEVLHSLTMARTLDSVHDELLSLYTPFDAPPLSHREAYLQAFLLVRSFAINTMRYGAPLSLE